MGWFIHLSIIIIFLASCGPTANDQESTPSANSGVNRISPSFDGPEELPYCSTQSNYSSTVLISGTAQFEARVLDSNGLGDVGTPQAIQFHEVVVTNSFGEIIQCGETNSLGQFSVSVPQGDATFTISINSRGYNQYLKASLFNAPEQNKLYSLSKTFTPDQNKDLGFFIAEGKNSVVGGAFNILDQVRKTNEFLINQVGSCSQFESTCPDFTVSKKVVIYWEKGFNPASYYGQSFGVSFYLPDKDRLFILGGSNGNVDFEDTDHFDNSIIIHEYTHFLEDSYSLTNSPGGSHNGNQQIDPRLAWSEGFSNFVQAAVLNNPKYIDTAGNIDGNTTYIFQIDLETKNTVCNSSPLTPGCDVPTVDGEGNFREFSITRFLWDTFDSNNDGETIENGFREIWSAMTSSIGFVSGSAQFISVGLLHKVQDFFSGKTDWDSLRQDANHLHVLDNLGRNYRHEYADTLQETGCTGFDFSFTPVDDVTDNGSFDTLNFISNNDFFIYNHQGGAVNLTLNYQDDDSSGVEADIDIYLYKEKHTLGESESILGQSQASPDANPSTAETETISITTLDPGTYLIQVMVYTGDFAASIPGLTNYELRLNGSLQCR